MTVLVAMPQDVGEYYDNSEIGPYETLLCTALYLCAGEAERRCFHLGRKKTSVSHDIEVTLNK